MMAVCSVAGCDTPAESHLDIHVRAGGVMRLARCSFHTPTEHEASSLSRDLDMPVRVSPIRPVSREVRRDLVLTRRRVLGLAGS